MTATKTPTPINAIRLGGWLRSSADAARTGFVSAMPRISKEVGGEVFSAGRLGPDSSAAGENVAGVQWWNGESEGNWLLAWVTHVLLAGDESERADVDSYLSRILEAQDSDGYIGMFTPAARQQDPYIGGDLWTQSRVLRALQIWAEARLSDETWAAVGRALLHAEHRYRQARHLAFSPPTGDSCGRGHDLMIVEAIHAQVKHAPDETLARFARDLYDDFSAADIDWPDADGQLQTLLSPEPFIGHGAHTAEHLRIPLLIHELTPDERLRAAFDAGMVKLAPATGATGALKSDETISEPGSPSLSTAESGFEFCGITELLLTHLEAARITDDLEHVDAAERLFLNAAQGGIRPDGKAVAYLIAENQVEATHSMGTRWDYSPTHDDVAVCCAPNAGRALPIYAGHMVLGTAEGVLVQLYGESTVDVAVGDLGVTVRQETSYPFAHTVRVTVTPDHESTFEVSLRIPGWCENPSLELDGVDVDDLVWGADRVTITARWTGDVTFTLSLPSRPRLNESADGRHFATDGPLVYAVKISEHERAHRGYADTPWSDLDVMPVDANTKYPPVLVSLGDAVETDGTAEGDPWVNSPVTLRATVIDPTPKHAALEGGGLRTIRLVPFGATTLRWTVLNRLRRS